MIIETIVIPAKAGIQKSGSRIKCGMTRITIMGKFKFFSFFKNHPALIFLLAILALAAFFRFWDLTNVPPGLYPDVAINGNDAQSALENRDFKLFYPENNGREGFFINLIALSFWIFGPSIWAMKLVAAIIGFLTVAGMYFLTKEVFRYLPSLSRSVGLLAMTVPEIIALLSTFFLTISFWHVNFSRLGFRAIMVPFCLVWSFYFLFKGAAQQKARAEIGQKATAAWKIFLSFALAGAFFGLGFHTYIAFRVAPLILIPLFFAALVEFWPDLKANFKNKKIFKIYWQKGWFGWDIFLLFLILVILPIAFYYFQHPADFIGRAGQVSIFASENPIMILADSTLKTFGQFLIFGDTNWRHNLSGSPEIFWPLIPFFWLGLGWFLWQIFRKKNYRKNNLWPLAALWTIIIWFGALLLPSILSREGLPHALRSIGAVIPAYIFTGLGFWLAILYLLSFLRKQESRLIKFRKTWIPAFAGMTDRSIKITISILIFIFLIIVAGFSYYQYFIQWGQNSETRGAFTQKLVDEAAYLNSLPQNVQKYVLVNEDGVKVPYPDGLSMPVQTIIFLTRGKSEIKYLTPDPEGLSLLESGPTVILPIQIDEKLFNGLQKDFPQGYLEKQKDFWAFKIGF